jgi:hypothetical protein
MPGYGCKQVELARRGHHTADTNAFGRRDGLAP